jgi:hypothetical protein
MSQFVSKLSQVRVRSLDHAAAGDKLGEPEHVQREQRKVQDEHRRQPLERRIGNSSRRQITRLGR